MHDKIENKTIPTQNLYIDTVLDWLLWRFKGG